MCLLSWTQIDHFAVVLRFAGGSLDFKSRVNEVFGNGILRDKTTSPPPPESRSLQPFPSVWISSHQFWRKLHQIEFNLRFHLRRHLGTEGWLGKHFGSFFCFCNLRTELNWLFVTENFQKHFWSLSNWLIFVCISSLWHWIVSRQLFNEKSFQFDIWIN